jgi:hypothetical protein
MIKNKDAQDIYPSSPPTNQNPNTSEFKEQGAHEKSNENSHKKT